MATSALQERRKRLVNRVGRHLPCNTIQVVSDFANVATKVTQRTSIAHRGATSALPMLAYSQYRATTQAHASTAAQQRCRTQWTRRHASRSSFHRTRMPRRKWSCNKSNRQTVVYNSLTFETDAVCLSTKRTSEPWAIRICKTEQRLRVATTPIMTLLYQYTSRPRVRLWYTAS